MALANFTDLKTAIETWLERTGDTTISGNAADFVIMAEARLNREFRTLRINTIDDATLTGTISSRQLTLPTNYLTPVSLFLTTYSRQDYLRPIIIGVDGLRVPNGIPRAWGINADKIDLDVPCDQAHTFLFRYHKKLALGTDTTNWLMTNYPDVYVYASVIEAATMLGDAETVGNYEAIIEPRIQAVKDAEGASLRIATATVDPALLRTRPFFDFDSGQ